MKDSGTKWSEIIEMAKNPKTEPEEFWLCIKDELSEIKNFPGALTKTIEIIRKFSPQLALYVELRNNL